jgi:hypothetical protein
MPAMLRAFRTPGNGSTYWRDPFITALNFDNLAELFWTKKRTGLQTAFEIFQQL